MVITSLHAMIFLNQLTKNVVLRIEPLKSVDDWGLFEKENTPISNMDKPSPASSP